MEKFSVLISVYHREKKEYLREALRSVFEQTIEPDEVVLVKDGALTAELDEVVDEFESKYKSLKVLSLPENVGLGMALNEGLKVCQYDLVARMDSDDISLPQRFELQLKAFAENPELSIVGGWISEFEDDPAEIVSERRPPETDEELKIFFRRRTPFNHPSVMFRRGSVVEAGGYRHFHLLEDYWLWGRMIKNGASLHNVQQTLVNMRGGVSMATRRGGWKYAKGEVCLMYRFYKMGVIRFVDMLRNIAVRFPVRIMPSAIRALIYSKLLRKKIEGDSGFRHKKASEKDIPPAL